MTCRDTQNMLADLFDAAPHEESELAEHLAACPQCAGEYAAMRKTVAALSPPRPIQASPDFKERVLTRLAEAPPPARRPAMIPRFVYLLAAALVLVLLAPFLGTIGVRRGHAPPPVLSLLAESVQAMANVHSVHILARMRTTPRENFDFIDPARNWVPLEIWSQYGAEPKWRVEKPGRVVAMDGASSLLVIRPNHVSRGTPRAGYLEWLRILLDPDQLVDKELSMARASQSDANLTQQTGQLTLTVHHPARRSIPGDDWLLNKGVSSSDHTRIYRFDGASKRLTGMQLVMHARGGDIAVFEIGEIRYDEQFDPALFVLAPPADAISHLSAGEMPTGPKLPQSAKEAAALFFDALAREDWGQVRLVYPYSGVDQELRSYGGLRVVHIGEPFRSIFYPGWYVPYEIVLRSGYVKKWNLAVRNDNPAGRWLWDGGL